MSQGGSLGNYDSPSSIDFDKVVVCGIEIASCLGNFTFLAVQLIQSLGKATLPFAERRYRLVVITFLVVVGRFKALAGNAQPFYSLYCSVLSDDPHHRPTLLP